MRVVITLLIALWCAVPVFAQPTLGSQVESALVSADTTVSLTGVSAGSGVAVIVFQTGSDLRTYGVSDNEDTGNSYVSIVNNDCGTSGRCVQIFADWSISEGDGTLSITIDQSASATYIATAIEINPSTSALSTDQTSTFSNTTTNTHYASADGTVIDTDANVFVFSGCVGDASFTTETVKDGNWTALSTANSNSAMGQYRNSVSALANERAEMTHISTARSSWCAVVSVKQAAASSGPKMLIGSGLI